MPVFATIPELREDVIKPMTPNTLPISETKVTFPITGAALFAMGNSYCAELVKGELHYMSPTGYLHGIVEVKIAKILSLFVEQHQLGKVLAGEVGIYTSRDPDTIRAADVLYISDKRMAQIRSDSYLDVAPELIAEVMSPGDRWIDIADKMDEYFAIGVQTLWCVDPRRRQVFVYTSPTDVRRFNADQKLSDEKILPGFEVVVSDLF